LLLHRLSIWWLLVAVVAVVDLAAVGAVVVTQKVFLVSLQALIQLSLVLAALQAQALIQTARVVGKVATHPS
jgi:hypothetical protein